MATPAGTSASSTTGTRITPTTATCTRYTATMSTSANRRPTPRPSTVSASTTTEPTAGTSRCSTAIMPTTSTTVTGTRCTPATTTSTDHVPPARDVISAARAPTATLTSLTYVEEHHMVAPDTDRQPGAIRATRQAAVVRDALAGRTGFTSAQDLHADLRRRGERVGLTTVYRRLQLLADSGEA